jgi:hypothetical protein
MIRWKEPLACQRALSGLLAVRLERHAGPPIEDVLDEGINFCMSCSSA